jgi:hypothetical protein
MLVAGIITGPGFWETFVLAALAVWRVTHLLASEDGPADLVFRLRTKLGSGFFGKLMDCFYCLSLWVAAPFAFIVTRQVAAWLLVWIALSGTACLLERATREPSNVQHFDVNNEGDSTHALLRPEKKRPEDQYRA